MLLRLYNEMECVHHKNGLAQSTFFLSQSVAHQDQHLKVFHSVAFHLEDNANDPHAHHI